MTLERRKNNRATPIKPLFASLGSNLSQVGKIVDISLGGFSFKFISDEKVRVSDTHVDLFSLDQIHCFYGLPCTLVYQQSSRLPGTADGGGDSFKARKCGLKYGKLQGEQRRNLADFLKKYAMEPDAHS